LLYANQAEVAVVVGTDPYTRCCELCADADEKSTPQVAADAFLESEREIVAPIKSLGRKVNEKV
jgi:hypothetical protein